MFHGAVFTLLASTAAAPGAEEASLASLRARAGGWLADLLGRQGYVAQDGGQSPSAALTALAAAALSRTDAAAHAAVLAGARARLRALQEDGGGFPAEGPRGPDGASAAWLAIAALAGSAEPADLEALARARTFVAGGAGGPPASFPAEAGAPAGEDLGRAFRFLAAGRTNLTPAPPRAGAGGEGGPAGGDALATLAGGPVDAGAARRALHARLAAGVPVGGLVATRLGGGELEAVHIAARVLAGYRSPRLERPEGASLLWPRVLLSSIRARWRPREGAFAGEPGGVPGARATALALLALDAIAPWAAVEDALIAAERSEPERAADLASDCAGCHRRLHPGLVRGWEMSRHAAAGVGCEACHGTNHSRSFRENGKVSPRVCGACHAREAAEFAGSRHAAAEATLLASALFAATPAAAREACTGCHRIGALHADGARGSCSFCHAGHEFRAAFAREPEACTGCHTGEDYPQDAAYWSSKHGALYARGRDAGIAPTCSTCHHPRGRHDDGFGIALGGSGTGGIVAGASPPVPMREVTREEIAAKRAEMVSACAECHSSRLAEESLRKADAVKKEGDELLARAAAVLGGLEADGLLAPSALDAKQVRVPPGDAGAGLRNAFYDMWRFRYAHAFKGAYHNSPSIANARSREGLAESLAAIAAGAEKLRRERDGR